MTVVTVYNVTNSSLCDTRAAIARPVNARSQSRRKCARNASRCDDDMAKTKDQKEIDTAKTRSQKCQGFERRLTSLRMSVRRMKARLNNGRR